MHAILQRSTSGESARLGKENTTKASKYAHHVEAAKAISERLWRAPDNPQPIERGFDKEGSIAGERDEPITHNANSTGSEPISSSSMAAQLYNQSFKKKNAEDWVRKLQAPTCEKKPSSEQLQFIHTVVKRCIQEARDEHNNAEYKSEPLRLILHGVPGKHFFFLKSHDGTCTR